MAASVSKTIEIRSGNVREAVFQVTMTGVTSYDFTTADHGFSNILSISVNNETTEADGLAQINTLSTGAQLGGIYLSDFTSDDVVTIRVLGN